MSLKRLMQKFEENTLCFLHDVSIAEHESVLKRWKYKLNARKKAVIYSLFDLSFIFILVVGMYIQES